MGFQTVPEALTAAGKAEKDAVAELRGARCAEPFFEVAAAVAGGASAVAAVAFADSWNAAFSAWGTAAEQHAAALAAAADSYVDEDRLVGERLPTAGPR